MGMKNFRFLLFAVVASSLGFYACSDDTDAEWRDKNIAFYNSLKTVEGMHEIGDSVNGFPGIYYQVLKEGTGEKPVMGNVVNVSYAGWIYNDTLSYAPSCILDTDDAFDYDNDQDFTVGSSSLVDGWNIALQYMPLGSKWRVYIPYNLGYSNSTHGIIPAYSVLIFDIYLREIVSEN